MSERERRYRQYLKDHEPKSKKQLKKILTYGGIGLFLAFGLFGLLNPENWSYVAFFILAEPALLYFDKKTR